MSRNRQIIQGVKMKTEEELKGNRKGYYQTDEWKAYQKNYYQKNKEKLQTYQKEWIKKNPKYWKKRKEYYQTDEWKAYQKEYNQRPEVILRKKERDTPENKERVKLYAKKQYEKNKERLKVERDKPENKEKMKLYVTKWIEEHKEELKAYRDKPENKMRMKLYYENNKEEIKVERDKPENKEKMKLYMTKWIEEHKEELKTNRDKPENKMRMKELSRGSSLKKKYNLSIDNYQRMIEQQNNKCAICSNGETNTFKGNIVYLSVDHDWKTGKVRELLCKNCNTSLGNLNEDISLFYKCIKYLKKHQEDKEESKYINLKKDGFTVTYQLTTEEYKRRIEQQGGVCAICRNGETKKHKNKLSKLSLDHNHKTGKVRELLCKNCNTSLGNLNDDISLFYKCIEYLKKHS